MAALLWDKAGKKRYELGSDHGVLYVQNDDGTYENGVAWNGLTAVTESREGGEQNKQYADNREYASITTEEKFNGTIEAFNYPNEFTYCDGKRQLIPGFIVSSQRRKKFGFVYRTKIGNDMNADAGHKLHIVYNARVKPSEEAHETQNDSPEAIKYSWEFTTTKEYYTVNGEQRAIAHIVIDSTKANKTNLSLLEDILYGSENYVAHLPTPEEIYLCLSGEEEIWAEDQEDGVLYIQQVWNAQDQENGVLYVE